MHPREQIALSLKRHLFPHGSTKPKALWIYFSTLPPILNIFPIFRAQHLSGICLKRHLTLSEILLFRVGTTEPWQLAEPQISFEPRFDAYKSLAFKILRACYRAKKTRIPKIRKIKKQCKSPTPAWAPKFRKKNTMQKQQFLGNFCIFSVFCGVFSGANPGWAILYLSIFFVFLGFWGFWALYQARRITLLDQKIDVPFARIVCFFHSSLVAPSTSWMLY